MGFVNAVLKPILKTIMFPIKPIIDPIETIGNMMIKLLQLILIILNKLPEMIHIFDYITDPLKMLTDFYWGVKKGIEMIFNTLIDNTFGKLSRSLNLSTLNDNDADGDDKGNDPNKSEETYCAKPSFIQIVLLLLCPPFALFTKLGLNGIIHIIMASILTYIYYFPGLIYASMYVL